MVKKILVPLLAMALLSVMAIPALAVGFTPSVTAKGAPEITTVTDTAGETAAAIIYDESGNEVASIPAGGLIVTPLSEAQQADETIKSKLISAYEQFNTTSLDDIAPGLAEAVKNYSEGMTVSDLVVRDLFDVSIYGSYEQELSVNGNSISIQFNLGLPSDALLLVLHNISGTTWELIPDDRVVRNADGSVTVKLDSLSPIAFLTDGGSLPVNPNAPSSPQTGYADSTMTCWIAVGVGGIALIALVFLSRKHAGN